MCRPPPKTTGLDAPFPWRAALVMSLGAAPGGKRHGETHETSRCFRDACLLCRDVEQAVHDVKRGAPNHLSEAICEHPTISANFESGPTLAGNAAHFYAICSLFSYAGFLAVDLNWAEDVDRRRLFVAVPPSVASRGPAAGCHVDIPRRRIVRALDRGDAAGSREVYSKPVWADFCGVGRRAPLS